MSQLSYFQWWWSHLLFTIWASIMLNACFCIKRLFIFSFILQLAVIFIFIIWIVIFITNNNRKIFKIFNLLSQFPLLYVTLSASSGVQLPHRVPNAVSAPPLGTNYGGLPAYTTGTLGATIQFSCGQNNVAASGGVYVYTCAESTASAIYWLYTSGGCVGASVGHWTINKLIVQCLSLWSSSN